MSSVLLRSRDGGAKPSRSRYSRTVSFTTQQVKCSKSRLRKNRHGINTVAKPSGRRTDDASEGRAGHLGRHAKPERQLYPCPNGKGTNEAQGDHVLLQGQSLQNASVSRVAPMV